MENLVITIEQSNILEIRINRPEKKNALTWQMYRDITDGLARAACSEHMHAVLIAGEGDLFCAGNDLDEFLAATADETAGIDFIRAIANFEKPIVAAVQGAAVGIGATMLLHCDLVYASPDASFRMPFVSLGLVPEAASSLLAPAAFGYGNAGRMLLLGEALSAQEALATGFLAEIVERDALYDYARRKAEMLAKLPPNALSVTRRLMRGGRAAINDRIEQEASLFVEALSSPEAREIISSFFARR